MTDSSKPNISQSPEIISLTERESLVRNNPGFSELSVSEVSELVSLMKEVHLNTGEAAVIEGDIIDSVYIIASGSLEITKQVQIDGKVGTTFLAILNQGENIGLKDAKLYTDTGTRSATARAIEPCVLLRLDLRDFRQFLLEHPNLSQSITKSAAVSLRMQFIKESDPFMKLSNQRIAWLANSVKEVTFNPGDIIFKQNDESDSCYMIEEGTVEITMVNKDGMVQKISTLQPGQLFGERVLLKATRRNATAKALTACRLLLLDREIISELAEEPVEISSEMVSRSIDFNHPIRRENIIHYQRTMADGQVITTLKDASRNAYHQLDEEGWFIWQQLNGRLTVSEITNLFMKQFGRFDPQAVLQIIHGITNSGFAYLDLMQASQAISGEPVREKSKGIFSLLQFEYFIKNPDKKVTAIYNFGGYLLFKIPALFFLSVFALVGLILFPAVFKWTIGEFSQLKGFAFLLICAVPISMTSKLLNPISKALIIKKFGHTIPHLAIGWKTIGPEISVDTSDLWLSSRFPRIATMLTGIAADLFAASVFTCYAYAFPTSYFAMLASLCAIYVYLLTLRSLNPLLDLDGYQLLTNVLDYPKLRDAAMDWILQAIRGDKERNVTVKAKRQVIIFFIYSICYMLIHFILAVLVLYNLPPDWLRHTWHGRLIYLIIAAGFFVEWVSEIIYYQKIMRLLSAK